jgi:hypothetical protein
VWTNQQTRPAHVPTSRRVRSRTIGDVYKPAFLHGDTWKCGHAHILKSLPLAASNRASNRHNAPQRSPARLYILVSALTCLSSAQKSTSKPLFAQRRPDSRLAHIVASQANFQMGDKESLRFKV